MKTWNELRWWTSDACEKTHTTLDWYSDKPKPWKPVKSQVYNALHSTPFNRVRVVIVGQDPYPTPGHATGLAFSVPSNLERRRFPPTLRNIFRELVSDLHVPEPTCGSLERWADQGVLLLNTSLTVGADKTNHFDLWKEFTNEVLTAIRDNRDGVVFCMWGRHAQSFLPMLFPGGGSGTHRVIQSSHPSPLSAHRGFLGSRPFSTINASLSATTSGHSKTQPNPINWSLP